MGTRATPEELSTSELVESILDDARRLLGQQVELVKQEIREQAERVAGAAASAGAGAGLVALGGVLTAHMAAHLVSRAARVPVWAGYGIIGGGLAAAGVALLGRARAQLSAFELAPPPQTVAAFRENFAWLREQTTGQPA